MKKKRQAKLLELINQYDIETQDDLIEMLRKHGFDVTQATVSRDIRELKIAKLTTGKGSYRYALPQTQQDYTTNMDIRSTLVDSIFSVEYAGNLVVLKTAAGLAQAVAVGIDGMSLPQVLGCVAGDDTIFIAARNEASSFEIVRQLRAMMRK